MDLQLVKMSENSNHSFGLMMDEWTKTGETIIPWAIRKVDYHDFDAYLKSLEESEPKEGYVPASTFSHMTGNAIFWLEQSISDIPLTKHYC